MTTNPQRLHVEKLLLEHMAQVLSVDHFRRMKIMFSEMSDYDFGQMIRELQASAPGSFTLKDFACAHKEAIICSKLRPSANALSEVPIEFLSEEENRKLLAKIYTSHQSDTIRLSGEGDQKLISLWEDGMKQLSPIQGVFIPSDLFFAETVPMLDCNIVVDETKSHENGIAVKFRVVIFSDYAEMIKRASEDAPVTVGAILINLNGATIISRIRVIPGFDSIMFGKLGYKDMPPKMRAWFSSKSSIRTIMDMSLGILETWYGLQIALLHPDVRKVFRHPRVVRDRSDEHPKNKQQNRKVRYVKEHIINSDELESVIFGEPGDYSRHALVWYVIGHWRTMGDGRKIFVKPYWKGALRDLKMSIPDREREIAQLYGYGRTYAHQLEGVVEVCGI